MARRAPPLIFTLLLLLAVALGGCPSPPPADNGGQSTATVVVTRDFGQELILAEEINIGDDTNAMTALKAVAEVETKYGGGFVKAIEGLSSEESNHLDWLYYINGISLSLGAKDYRLRDGDTEHWDLRDWSYLQFVPAIIGDFPQPFLSGIKGEVKPTAVVYDPPFAGEAEALAVALEARGVAEVALTGTEALSDGVKEQSNLVIVGGADNGLILELSQMPKKLGFFARLEGGKITVLDEKGEPAGEYGAGCGLVQATQNPWSPRGVGGGESIVFMVSGADNDGVSNAANMLINNSDQLRYAYAILVNNSDIIKIP
jgi:hypothetical protein